MNDYSKAVRAAVRARIVTIDAEVHQLRERIRVLETERDTCKRRLEAYKYPVLALPNEITSEIFVHFLPHYPSCPPLAGIDSPTTLTQICRKWREIALANPKLWRGISIDFPHDRAEKLRVVQKWLDRSGSCPLSIKMECDYSGATTLNGYFQETLLHRARWQHVRLELRADEVALIEGPMPLLESLYLAVDEWYYTHPTVSVSDFPRLRSVSLENASHWKLATSIPTNNFDVKHLARRPLPFSHTSCGELGSLYLIDCAPPRSGTPNTFTRLETLVVLDKLGRRHTFDMLILPALRGPAVVGRTFGPGAHQHRHFPYLPLRM
ncbi:hypothetical protein FB45DRAFT_353771 [Roridomyces roridus]|uniref:F-box domain-containing protein n=1 Tax=Roridomyces roridus TaxID=1738132 RepID=A0AAD7C740_9AGAR|nr:hypothetical protein FB45DRAFT_353771 [Roridomyces roridus]